MTTRTILRRKAFAYSGTAREIRAPGTIQLFDDDFLGHDSTASRGRSPVSPTASSPPLKLTLFGGPSLSRESGILSLSPFQGALLGVLATHGQRGIRRGELITLLWNDGDDELLRRRLNQLIYSLHRRLPEGRIVRLVGDIYMFEEGRVSSDLDFFLGSVRDARLADAMGVVGRGFLSGLESTPTAAFERWVETRERRFRSDVRTLASDRWREGEQRADWSMAEEAADSLLRLDPDDEGSLRKLLESRALRGHVREAESTYVEFLELARIEDPEYEPEEETEHLFSRLRELGSASMTKRPHLSNQSPSDTVQFIGRVDELRHLTRTIRKVREEGIHGVLVTGEGGIGKTRLIQEALARAPFDGVRVLSGRCSEFEKNIPLSAILGALSGNSWVSSAIQELSDPWRSTLSNLLPDKESEGNVADAGHRLAVEDIPRVTCEAFLHLFETLARSDPIVLFLDDLQWIDATSLSVLAYVSERWTEGGLCTIGALREGDIEPRSQLRRWLSASSVARDFSDLSLGPLPRADIVRLLTSSLSTVGEGGDDQGPMALGWIESIAEASDGHPLLALECVRSLMAEGAGQPTTDSRRLPIPKGLQEMVSLRVSRLSRDGAHLVGLLSASDKPLGVSILEAACGLGHSELAIAIDEAMSRRLLGVSPRGVDCQHSLLRSAVYHGLSSGQRIEAHRSIANALLSQGESPPVLDVALHLLMAGDPRRAMPYVLGAARAATEAGGWAEAKHLLKMALESGPVLSEKADISALLGHVSVLLGDLEDARSQWETAETCYRALGKEDEVLVAKLRSLEVQRLQPGTDREELLQTLRGLREEASDRNLRKLVAECLNAEVRLLDGLRRFDDVRDLTSGVLSLVDLQEVESHVELLLVSAVDAVYGDPARAGRLADEAAEIASAHNRPDLLLKALNWKIIALGHTGQLGLAVGRNAIAKTIELARASKSFEQRFLLHANLGVWFIDTGQYEAASRSLGRAEEILGTLAAPELRRNLLINRGLLALDLGLPSEATEYFEGSLRVPGASEYDPARHSSLAGVGLAHLMSGKLHEARSVWEKLPDRPTEWTFDPYLWISFATRLSALTTRNDCVLRELEEEEGRLRDTIALAWVRLRLLRFEIMLRWRRSPAQKEVRELSHFLIEHDLLVREAELTKLLSRHRHAI